VCKEGGSLEIQKEKLQKEGETLSAKKFHCRSSDQDRGRGRKGGEALERGSRALVQEVSSTIKGAALEERKGLETEKL